MSFFNAGLNVPSSEGIVLNGSTSGTVTINAPASITSYTLTLPTSNGNASQVLQTDGSGVLSFVDISVSNIAADNIIEGDAAVTISTTSGDVNLNAPTGQSVDISINNADHLVIDGTAIQANINLVPLTNDVASLGNSSLQWSDLYLADGGVIYLGNDQDVTLTHVADTGLLLNGSSQLQFRDSALYINSSADGQLDIAADSNVTITTPDVIVSSNLSVSKGFVVGVDSITANSAVSGSPTALIDVTNYAAVKNINITNNSDTYFAVTTSGISNGQMLHLFYENGGTGTSRIDFGASKLYAGTGTAQYLTFSATGQSATLIFLDDGTSGWRIINTGGAIS